MSTDRQHTGTQFPPESTNVLIKGRGKAEQGVQEDEKFENKMTAEDNQKQKHKIRKKSIWRCERHTDGVQLNIKRGRKVGQIEVIPWRHGGEDGRRRGGGGDVLLRL